MLWGQDKKSVEPEDEGTIISESDADAIALEVLKMFRKRGPPGKLHNVLVWICRSCHNRERLHDWQATLSLPIYELVRDNETRWNLAFNSFKRAIEQRGPIEGMLDEELRKWHKLKANYDGGTRSQKPPEQPAIIDDYLTADDWSMIIELMKLLEPLEQATKRLQGHGDGSSLLWPTILDNECIHVALYALLCSVEQSSRAEQSRWHVMQSALFRQETLNVTIKESQDPLQRPTFDPELPSSIPGNSGANLGNTGPKSGKSSTKSARKAANGHTSTRAPLEALIEPSQDTSQPIPSQGPLGILELNCRRDRQILCTNINLGWAKLMKYCTKTDLSAANVAALILHPRYNWCWLKKKWNYRQDWLKAAVNRMRALWKPYLAFSPPPSIRTRPRNPPRTEHQVNLLWSDSEDDDEQIM
ncbi:hypothetical protein D6D22_10770 [Aureobasidium pullulans]|uniref:Uncharacterized protein n=1 Tax=Aureobasidium pullulans TaxID=5580 RepID=A0A4S8WR41_AURPU|nr:hypothetical protein D6D22_10770 [Aureobasidium pullulans]